MNAVYFQPNYSCRSFCAIVKMFWCPGSGWESDWHWEEEKLVRVAEGVKKRRQGTSLPTTGTAKGKCLNHLKLQRHGSVTAANGNRVCVECLACLGPSLLLSLSSHRTSPLHTINCYEKQRVQLVIIKCCCPEKNKNSERKVEEFRQRTNGIKRKGVGEVEISDYNLIGWAST